MPPIPSPILVSCAFVPAHARDLVVGDSFRFAPRERVVWCGEQSRPGTGRYVRAGYWPSTELRVWNVVAAHGGLELTVSTNGITNPKKRRVLWLYPSQLVERRDARQCAANEPTREAA